MTDARSTPPSRSYEDQLHYMGRQAQMLAEEGNDVSSDVMAECARAYAAEHKRAEEATLQLGYMKAGVYQQQAKGWETITRLLDEIAPGWSSSVEEYDGKTMIQRATEAIKRLSARSESKPIDMVLFCPKCAHQHVDRPQPEKGWTNPPHKSHECQNCGYIWRTADVPTNGVRATTTSSRTDSLPKPCDLAGYDP